MVYVDKLEGDNPISLRSGIGQANPPHTTALGKALLSTHAQPRFLVSLRSAGSAIHGAIRSMSTGNAD
jgi:DNA-binding IclR family transcriptional regulator